MINALIVLLFAIVAYVAGGVASDVYSNWVLESDNPPYTSSIDLGAGWQHPAQPGTKTCIVVPPKSGAPFLVKSSTPVDSCLSAHNEFARKLNIAVFAVPIFLFGMLLWIVFRKKHTKASGKK